MMQQTAKELVHKAFYEWTQQDCDKIESLPMSGSNRQYYRITVGKQTYIATYNNHVVENRAFNYFTHHFLAKKISVPRIFYYSADEHCYFQEDLGDRNLLSVIEQKGYTPKVLQLLRQTVKQLATMQIMGSEGIDYKYCVDAKVFDKQAVLNDLLYFKYYFLDVLYIPYSKESLQKDFQALADYLSLIDTRYFMFRDFQSRNIMVRDDQVYFIDYQGGMEGCIYYDIASFLWQAKAQLPQQWKDELLQLYYQEVNLCLVSLGKTPLNFSTFVNQYQGFVLIRMLQVLGAYGFRGIFQQKNHFLLSIPLALRSLKEFIKHKTIAIPTPTLDHVIAMLDTAPALQRFMPADKLPNNCSLNITINSFSYVKGIPTDGNNNGGGFVFDLRGIDNPGRNPDMACKNGSDEAVQIFLVEKTAFLSYMRAVWTLLDTTIDNYLKRNFTSLLINFGCTGGQHRSVYAAIETHAYLKSKYPSISITLNHTNQEHWKRD
ncbi:MAG: RNase adapter RapZ [Phycisphaerales bacterium]|nr:RNase adapter RapZ [Phycisphaerales bacterium]